MGDVIKKIGASNSPVTMDYSTVQAWEDALPANLVTDGNRQIGNCYNQGTLSGNLNISGETTDATNYILLQAFTGASFRDDAGALTNPLFYNNAKGIALEGSGNYASCFVGAPDYTVIRYLQLKNTGSGGTTGINITTGGLIDSCILDSPAGLGNLSGAVGAGGLKVVNCLIVVNAGNGPILSDAPYHYCTIVNRSGSPSSTAISGSGYHASHYLKNCAVFGFSTFSSGTTGPDVSYIASDLALTEGTNNQASLTYASQFVSTTTDYTPKVTGSLKNGTPDTSYATVDILGVTRDATTPYIGCRELATASGTPFNPVNIQNPRTILGANRGSVDVVKLNLLGKDQFFTTPGQGPNYDWPNPRGNRYPISNKGFDNNLIESTLYQSTLALPFNYTDFPNPRGSKQGPIELRTFLDPLKLNLYGQDTFFNGAGRGPNNYDFKNPSTIRRVPYFESNNLLENTLGIVIPVVMPFSQLDHPNPRGARYPSSLRTFTGELKLNLLGQDSFFYGPGRAPVYDFPNPRGLRRNDQIRNLTGITFPSRFPTVSNCSWEGHFTSRGWLSPQNQISAGYPIYIQPTLLSGYYEEVIDYGTTITNTIASLRWSQTLFAGSVTVVTKMAVSTDGNTYTPFQSGTSIFFSTLRFLKIRFEFTATDDTGLIEVSNVQTLLDVKREVDSGSVIALAGDTFGTPVLFNKAFKDIDSITLTVAAIEPVTAIYDFVDVPNPAGFSVYAFSSTGNRITYLVSWKARGIV